MIGRVARRPPRGSPVQPGTAIRISTGAALPEGADAVVPVERAEDRGERGERAGHRAGGEHPPRGRGRARAATSLLVAGTRLGPAELGVAASVGRAELRCARRPRVALVVTGDELARPGDPLEPGRIYSSNGYVLAAQVEQRGSASS